MQEYSVMEVKERCVAREVVWVTQRLSKGTQFLWLRIIEKYYKVKTIYEVNQKQMN